MRSSPAVYFGPTASSKAKARAKPTHSMTQVLAQMAEEAKRAAAEAQAGPVSAMPSYADMARPAPTKPSYADMARPAQTKPSYADIAGAALTKRRS